MRILTNEEILTRLGKDFDITVCQICGAEIVVREAEMEYPMCNRAECVELFLESNY